MLKAGEAVGQGAHVSAALHIVLPSQRIQTAGVTADMPSEQGKVDQRRHIVDAVMVLGNTKCPADHRPLGGGE